MSYNPLQKFWDERHERRHDHPQPFNPEAEGINYNVQPEYDPFDDLYYMASEYHKCWLCHEPGLEATMIKNNLRYWVHIDCELQMEETLKQLNHEQVRND